MQNIKLSLVPNKTENNFCNTEIKETKIKVSNHISDGFTFPIQVGQVFSQIQCLDRQEDQPPHLLPVNHINIKKKLLLFDRPFEKKMPKKKVYIP